MQYYKKMKFACI